MPDRTEPLRFDGDLTACAALVERADPERFRAAMAAPPGARLVLFPLYALNVEVSRAPWVTQEPMIAEMRLQWWREALAQIAKGDIPRRHEVITPLSRVLSPGMAARLDAMVAVRRWDIYTDPFEDEAHFDRYIDETSGTLIWAAARSLGEAGETVVRDFAFGVGVANWLRAIPELEARGRVPLLDGRSEAVAALADRALGRMESARAGRRGVSQQAAPALLVGWQAGRILRQARRDPSRVGTGALGTSEARTRLALMARAATGRW